MKLLNYCQITSNPSLIQILQLVPILQTHQIHYQNSQKRKAFEVVEAIVWNFTPTGDSE